MNIVPEMKIGLRGEYRAVLNQGTDRESDTGWMPNLITNFGMDSLASDGGNAKSGYLSVGTGSAAPSNVDTALQAFVASTTPYAGTDTASDATSPYTVHMTVQYNFAQGAVVGNIAELGLGGVSGGTSLFSRCLIVDRTGVATTLSVTAIDQLTVYYRLNVTYVVTDSSGSVTLAGTSYAYTARAAYATNVGGKSSILQTLGIPSSSSGYISTLMAAYDSASALGPLTGGPTGIVVSTSTTQSQAAYSAGSYYRDVTITVGASTGNPAGGIGALVFFTGSNFAWQYQFTPAIPKDNTKTLALTFRVSWARA